MPSLLDQIERVPVSSVSLFPGNARKGNKHAIAASLAEHGQVTPLVVQLSTRHVLGGNNTLEAARSLGWTEVDVVFIDVDDQRAARINLVLNRTADLAEWDSDLLLDQLAGLDDLDGTGYALDDMEDLRRITGALGREATGFLGEFTTPPPPPALPAPGPAPSPAAPPPPADPDGGGTDDSSTEGDGERPPGYYSSQTPPPEAPPVPPPPAAPEWVQLAWTVSPGSRETIRRAIALAQNRGSLGTAAEGLLAMAAFYLNAHQ